MPVAHAAPTFPIITEYLAGGSPFRVAVEAPGRVWYTLPAQNAIGNLVAALPSDYQVNAYPLPIADSEPYDIAYATGAVWVTERMGNKVARFDPVAASWTEYDIPTANSQPTGLIVLPGQPVQIWFAERAGNKLGLLAVADDLTGALVEFPLPAGSPYDNAEMEDVAATSGNAVWFTLPGSELTGRFNLSLWDPANPTSAFAFQNPRNYPWLYPGKILRPWQIKLDGIGLPWITEPGTNQLMRFNPGTVVSWEHHPVLTPDSGLDGLYITQMDVATDDVMVWYTARTASRVGQLRRVNFRTLRSELPLPASAPTDIAVDADGCAWIAAGGTNSVVRWCAPYFWRAYLPLVLK